MALQIRITGPELDTTRMLEAGQGETVLGRDASCHIRLPDPQRNVSRRHLALRNLDDELHFRVLSVVNGVEMPFGEAPPGAQGVVPHGQGLKVGDYDVSFSHVPSEPDPWAALEGPPRAHASEPPADAGAAVPHDDPFGDWEFESTFETPGGGPASTHASAPDVSAFFEGLGLDPAQVGPLSPGELEAMGRMVRDVLMGLIDLGSTVSGAKEDLNAEDRTMLAVKDNNPLKTNWPAQAKLQYLLGGRASSVGFIPQERAVRQLLDDLRAHEHAVTAAARAAVEGTVREFEPAALKSRLLGGTGKLFESGRAWDAYVKHWSDNSRTMPDWIARLLSRHFSETYLKESARYKRGPAPAQE